MKKTPPQNIIQASHLLQQGLSSYSLTQIYLENIYKQNSLNAFITIVEKEALLEAIKLDNEIKAGKPRSILHGIPIVIKDNIDTHNVRTTVGSELLHHRIPVVDADVVARLKAAGAIILGKTNLSEFGADITGNNSFYGNVRSAINPSYSPGGSSSGTATAVAANLCIAGIGTDTGGSIRVPASWSGIVGLRPTHSLISTNGVFKRAPSFDVVGIMANNVVDVEILFNVIVAGTSLCNIPTFASTYGYKLGVISNFTWSGVEAEVAAAIHRVILNCKQAGIEVINIDNKFLSRYDETNYSIIALYEFNQVFNELRHECSNYADTIGNKVANDLRKGTAISRRAYNKALKHKQDMYLNIQEIFKRVDAIITPTTPVTAPHIQADYRIYQRSRKFVVPFSYLGLPCISIPCGFNKQGLPIGLQIIGNHFQDRVILKIAADLEFQLQIFFSNYG